MLVANNVDQIWSNLIKSHFHKLGQLCTSHMLRLWRSHASIGCCDSGYPAIEPLRRRTQGQSWLWQVFGLSNPPTSVAGWNDSQQTSVFKTGVALFMGRKNAKADGTPCWRANRTKPWRKKETSSASAQFSCLPYIPIGSMMLLYMLTFTINIPPLC